METHNLKQSATMIVILLLISQFVYSQDGYFTIKGKLKNENNRKEIIFANVTIVGTSISTVSNIDGEFLIKIDKSLKANELKFSHVGFNSKIISISDLNKKRNIIYLNPSDIIVQEVQVRPENARKIVEAAMDNVDKNYSGRALNAHGFYRETIKRRRDYLTIAEALVDIYKSSYSKLMDLDRVKIFKGRKSSDVKRADTLAVKMKGGPGISLLFDIVKNPHTLIPKKELINYNFIVNGIKTVDKKLVYEIAFKPAILHPEYPMLIGKYFINVESLAIVSVEFSIDLSNPEKASALFVKKKPLGVKITPDRTSYIVNYKEINGLYFFNYSRSEVRFKCNWKQKLFNSHYTIMSELAITDWSTETAQKIKYKESFKTGDVFEEKVSAFADKDFWGAHNTIEPDKSIESAIKKYHRKFKNNK